MKFLVYRTSDINCCDAVSPCEGAEKYVLPVTRYENAPVYESFWVKEIATLQELMKIVATEGDGIIGIDETLDMPYLEIYDDYRE